MDSEKIKRMLDACYMAKRIRELLPKLPDGVSPAYIQYLDVIHTMQKTKEYVKVSDISDALNLPRPGREGISQEDFFRRRRESYVYCDYKKWRRIV